MFEYLHLIDISTKAHIKCWTMFFILLILNLIPSEAFQSDTHLKRFTSHCLQFFLPFEHLLLTIILETYLFIYVHIYV